MLGLFQDVSTVAVAVILSFLNSSHISYKILEQHFLQLVMVTVLYKASNLRLLGVPPV